MLIRSSSRAHAPDPIQIQILFLFESSGPLVNYLRTIEECITVILIVICQNKSLPDASASTGTAFA